MPNPLVNVVQVPKTPQIWQVMRQCTEKKDVQDSRYCYCCKRCPRRHTHREKCAQQTKHTQRKRCPKNEPHIKRMSEKHHWYWENDAPKTTYEQNTWKHLQNPRKPYILYF